MDDEHQSGRAHLEPDQNRTGDLHLRKWRSFLLSYRLKMRTAQILRRQLTTRNRLVR